VFEGVDISMFDFIKEDFIIETNMKKRRLEEAEEEMLNS